MKNCCPETLVAAVTTAAIAIAKDLNSNEVALLASVFVQLGDTLATIAVVRDTCESS
jgi:hypothetical protein